VLVWIGVVLLYKGYRLHREGRRASMPPKRVEPTLGETTRRDGPSSE
jgi:hypothetical protein